MFNPVPFLYGQTFLFQNTLDVSIPTTGGAFLSGTGAYGETLSLRGFELFDGNGNPMSDASISSEQGDQISVLTPEPESWLSMISALAALALVSCGKRLKSTAVSPRSSSIAS